MSKQPDFANDLAALSDSVTAEVGDVLQVLQQKRSATGPMNPSKIESPKDVVQPIADGVAVPEQPAAQQTIARRQRSASRSRLLPTLEREEPLENVTTRLRQKTNELLTEAALRQRLKKETPSTRQDIVEAALTDWFRKHRYARGHDEETID